MCGEVMSTSCEAVVFRCYIDVDIALMIFQHVIN